jgi:signal transduction histidine kinase
VTFQRKLFLGFLAMTIPVVIVGAEALRSNREQRRALEALGDSFARSRTFAELETAMFNQAEVVWQFLTGLSPRSRDDFETIEEVIAYWQARWESELGPEDRDLARRIDAIHGQIRDVSERVFALADSGRREEGFRLADQELKGRILPELTRTNREIYGATRERSVRRAYDRLEEVLAGERRVLFGVLGLSLVAGVAASLVIARGLASPVRRLKAGMDAAGRGRLDEPLDVQSRDEIGDLARAFGDMRESLRRSHTELAGANAELAAKVSELERTQAQLIRAERLASIGEMSAAVAHGLRNPLASLRAAAQLALHQMRGAPAAREQLEPILAEVDRLDRRIEGLLGYSRPAGGNPTEQSPARIVQEVLPAFAARAAERGVEISTDVPAGLPAVLVDPYQIEQALLEVIANAFDAMAAGGRLSIRGRLAGDSDGLPRRAGSAGGEADGTPGHGDGGRRVVLEVTDTGPGIASGTLPSVFEPFFTTRVEGTGLGLAIARRYVEGNGGRIAVASRPGAGTTVRMEFPPAESVRAAAAAGAA